MSQYTKAGQDFMHEAMIGMATRGLYENMALYGSGLGAIGAGIGGIGGALYGNRDTDVLTGAGIGLGIGAALGAGGAFAFKPKANQYVKGLSHRYNTMAGMEVPPEDKLEALASGYSVGNWVAGAPFVGPNERRIKLTGMPIFG